MVDFAGWSMPVMYRGIIEEHTHTREQCSMFDVSHMGRLKLRGPDARPLLQWLCTRNLDGMEPGVCRYTHMCKEDGGILDDMIVSRFDDDWGVVCNASNREKITAWVRKQAEARQVELTDETFETAMIAIQGPKAVERAQALIPIDLSEVGRYRFKAGTYMMTQYAIYRSGYTGEDGYEVVVPAELANLLAGQLLAAASDPEAVIKPAGLGARDTLRLEAGMPLYGHELHEHVDPLTAGQNWCVDLEKDFVGAEPMRALKASGLKRALVGLELEGRRTARQHCAVRNGDTTVGEITSGCLSPTLGKSIAMAFVEAEYAKPGTGVAVDVSGKPTPAVVVKLPFYKRPKQPKA